MELEHNSFSPLDDLRWQDEILQVMFWLLGEGFADNVTPSHLSRFLDAGPDVLHRNLQYLSIAGVLRLEGERYRLTEMGAEEAQRRFVDEFRPYLGRSGHGECSDDCWCHDPDHVGEPCPSTVHASRVAS